MTKAFFLFILFSSIGNAQFYTVKGKVTDNNNHAVPFLHILLKNKDKIVQFSTTDENGFYNLKISDIGEYKIIIKSLYHKNKEILLNIDPKNDSVIIINIPIAEKIHELNEVILKGERSIKEKEDTINFKVKYFKDGTEETVEDLLKKIPGLNIDASGNILIGNREIEKLMIDGDDIFGKGYKVLSKNMPAYPIEEIEILNNFSNNRLVKGIEESNKVALNLKLNEKSKRVWFGNFNSGLNFENKYTLKAVLMNFGVKAKYFFLTNLNSIGENSTGELNNLIYSYETSGISTLGNNQNAWNLINLFGGVPNFKRSRTNLNNAELISLNAIFNPTEKLKVKTLGFFNWDETDFFRNTTNNVEVNSSSFTNSEEYNLRNKKKIAFGKLDLIYNISKIKMLEATTKYNYGNFRDNSNLLFNGNSTMENLKHQNTLFDQKLTYTHKFKDKKVFLLTGRYIDEKSPQNYTLNTFLYQDLFPDFGDAKNVSQSNTNQMQFAGFNAHILDRKENGNLLELQLGNEFRNDKLSTVFSLLDQKTILEQPSGYINETEYRVNDLYFKTKYRLKINNFAIVGKLNLHQLFNHLDNNGESAKQNPFFINPSIGFDWKVNNKNKITSSYAYNTTNANVLDVYSDYVLRGFRSFSKGTNRFNQLTNSAIAFNYQLGNWSDRFFTNTSIIYTKNHDFFSSNTLISQNYSLAEKILIKDREFISIHSKLDYYFKFLSSNLKLNLGYTKSTFKNIVNNSSPRQVKSNNYNYGFELRSGFRGIFNYHLGTKWTTSEIITNLRNSFTNNVSFLDLAFVFSDKFNIQLQTERYYFGNLKKDKNYFFLDLDSQYKLIKNKLTLGISGKNLFNTTKFRNFSINDIGTSTTEYRLLPRFILFKVEYRF